MKRVLIALVTCLAVTACTTSDEVVAYGSEDQVFSEPILRDFERETGIEVRAVFDTEEAKGTGVMNRLLAEKANPQADLYWANEPIRAVVLKQEGVAAPYVSPNAEGIPDRFKDPEGYWTGFAARARVLVVGEEVRGLEEPSSIQAYTDPTWEGRAVIANPLFGTTAIHMAALHSLWGEQKLESVLAEIRANQVAISTSNGESTDLVCAGAFAFSLVDTDDGVARLRQGCPIRVVYPDQGQGEIGTLVLPNAVVLIGRGPNPDNARRLIDYLLSRETERKLAASDAAQIPLHPGVETPAAVRSIGEIQAMQIDYEEVARTLQRIMPMLKAWVEQ